MPSNYVDSLTLVPHICKAQFDDVATEFLTDNWPEALEKPMAVPIMKIAKEKMGLTVRTDCRLSEDLSILGMTCFTSGKVDIYDKEEDEFREMIVRRGTIFIDPDTYWERTLGCFTNTAAHECLHWYKHRYYHFAQSAKCHGMAIACRCPTKQKDEATQAQWDDEDWMEWQATGIAPRILMPKQTFPGKVEAIKRETISVEGQHYLAAKAIIKRVADYFSVSQQSAAIRIEELGISV